MRVKSRRNVFGRPWLCSFFLLVILVCVFFHVLSYLPCCDAPWNTIISMETTNGFVSEKLVTVVGELRNTSKTDASGRITSLLKRRSQTVVPNVVHYVWFGQYNPLEFHHYISIKSSAKYIRPDTIFFHCDFLPEGHYWKSLIKEVNLTIVHRDPPTSIYGHRVKRAEHKSDLARIDILIEHGGIYLDTDVVALRDFSPLRYYDYTMGLEYHGAPGRLNNGVLIAKPNATFLHIWRQTYKNFSTIEWDYHDTQIPYKLQYLYPDLIHVEEKSLNFPSGPERRLIYDGLYDWGQNYCIHLWYRLHGIPHTENGIRGMNTTFGQIARMVYYNTTELLSH